MLHNTILRALHVLTTTLEDGYLHNPHFIREETEAKELCSSLKVIQAQLATAELGFKLCQSGAGIQASIHFVTQLFMVIIVPYVKTG